MNANRHKHLGPLVLSCALFLLAFGYYATEMKLGELMWRSPWGIHQWRQADGASMALTYYQDGNAFLQPKIHHQLHNEGHAGGEMPIVYYTASRLYHWLGRQDYIIRWMHFALFLSGILVFIGVFTRVFNLPVYSALAVLFTLSGPTIMYYSMNFLPDAAAWGLSVAAVALIILGRRLEPRWSRFMAYALFVVVGWLKISMLIPFMAITAYEFFEESGWSERLKHLLWTSVVLLPIALWYLYIGWYNAAHESAYFATGIRPIWNVDGVEFSAIWKQISNEWLLLSIPHGLRWVLLLAAITVGVSFRKIPKELLGLTLWSAFGSLIYFLLFFANLGEHDYYFIPILFPILFLILSAHIGLHRTLVDNRIHLLSKVALGLVCFFLLGKAMSLNKKSYHGWFRDLDLAENIVGIEQFLDEQGITKQDKVFVAQDFSSNQVLYFLNRKGWTQLTGIYDTDDLDPLIDEGVSHAVVLDTSFYSVNFVRYHIQDTIGFHNGIGVYRIGHTKWWNGAPTP